MEKMTKGTRKRQRSGCSSRLSSTVAAADSAHPDETLTESSQKPRRNSSSSNFTATCPPLAPPIAGGFNDPSTADVILRLYIDNSPFEGNPYSIAAADASDQSSQVQIYVHSSALRRAKYFGALLSDRWSNDDFDGSIKSQRLNLSVAPSTGAIHTHLMVIQLLYSDDLSNSIDSVSTALTILPVALKLLFEDCIKQCVRFLEAVPWSEEEEQRILNLIPLLAEDESKELLARVSPANSGSSEEMLHSLIVSAIHNHPNVAAVKAFVAMLLRDFSSRDSAKRVLERAFSNSLKVVKESLEEYSSPEFRGDHNETEAIQRLNLHAALINGKQLLWLVERMIELRVADSAVREWSGQTSFATDLQRAFREDAWRNIVPGLPSVVLKCTCKLANAVAAGTILASWQVRKKLVQDWLPVLIVCKDNASPTLPNHKTMLPSPRSLYVELEEAFLQIISTLPMSEAQELLQQCLSFSTRDSEDCPHLITAFNTCNFQRWDGDRETRINLSFGRVQ
ncbi:hypothetical protein Nepgr_004599 [Nepenthes gracilis]|uniref:BTB/POZ domain-containing protein n=1 Tax=Nepenthes gracilis TaxID=150966 RepID=A0AAD3XFG6_NEPGR|nr:hypothetical protein Nepgr_004599 [Nepenthes gracilis]